MKMPDGNATNLLMFQSHATFVVAATPLKIDRIEESGPVASFTSSVAREFVETSAQTI